MSGHITLLDELDRAYEKIELQEERIENLLKVAELYGSPGNWDYYDSIKEGNDIPENPSTPWNAVFLTDDDDSDLMDGYGLVSGPAYVNGKFAREAISRDKELTEEK
jgi:hypothetical protein